MLKKPINYTDYNGVKTTEDHYFNLSTVELMEMEMSIKGGLSETLKKIAEEEDVQKIIQIFKDLILKSYGVKSEDGKRFIKSDELREAFSQSEAFNVLFMELVSNAEAAANFVKGIIPAEANAIPPAK